ncbi:MAG: phytanoyl-CoA dioxygenase family protein [Alphaproteobacteria bacterium]|jgi:ectoine hydroxylase
MTPEEILSYPPRVLTQEQREVFFREGYLGLPGFVEAETVKRLQATTERFVELSRQETKPGNVFDVAPEHTAEKPVLRRLKRPDERDETYWAFARDILADVAADLLGPDVVFHHSKMNFKWFSEADTVKWHQDAQFFPHTNYNVLTIGCYLADTDMNNGPLAVMPRSHDEELYDQYAEDGTWTGHLRPEDAAKMNMSKVQYLMGPAGSLTIHGCRMAHFSPSSKSPSPRPLLLNCFTSADARAYTPHPDPSAHTYEIVRGKPAKWAHHDPRPCQIPPDWSGGYTSIYAAQAGEDRAAQ